LVREDTLEDIQQSVYQIGQRIGRSDRASTLVQRIKKHFELIREKLQHTTPSKVVMLVGHEPMVAVGAGTFLSELLVHARADNIAARLAQQWPRLSVEYVIATAPDVIIDGQMGSDAASPRNFWRKYPTLPAVKKDRIYGFPEDPILRPGPRIWKSLDMLVALIHPEISLPSELDGDNNSAGAL
jgi:ABC-type Fe3+-hydroxamate transport system substrate-binding protein